MSAIYANKRWKTGAKSKDVITNVIDISHRLFWCRCSNLRDVVASSPSFSLLADRARQRACLQATLFFVVMYAGCELKTGVGSGNFQYSWVWDTGKIAGYGNFNQRWLLSHWVCVCVARLCCQVMSVKGNKACQIYPLSSYVSLFLSWYKLVLFFLFQSTAFTTKAEVGAQTSPISKPANIFWGFSTICISYIFNYMVILCI